MAEEDTNNSIVTPERIIKSVICPSASDGFTVSKKSVGSISHVDSSTKILSQESLSHSSCHNVASRYMRPSTGSCHDMCKYGRKHIFEEKPWKARRRPGKDSADGKVSLEKDKFVNHELSQEAGDHPSSKDKLSPKISSPRQSPDASIDKENRSRFKKLDERRRHSLELNFQDAKTHLSKSKITPDAKAKFGLKTRSSTEKKHSSPDPPEIIKNVCFPTEIVGVPKEQGSSVDSNLPKEMNLKTCLLRRHSAALNSKAAVGKLSCSFKRSSGTYLKGRQIPEYERGQIRPVIKASPKRVLHPPVPDVVSRRSLIKTASKVSAKGDSAPSKSALQRFGKSSSFKLRKAGQLKLISSLKDQSGVRRVKTGMSTSEKAINKAVQGISIETEEKVPKVSDKVIGSSLSASSGPGITGVEVKIFAKKQSVKTKGPATKDNQSMTLKKGLVSVSEDVANIFPVKLKFKSGKVLDRQCDSATPRRLRFRRPGPHGNEGSSKIDLLGKVSLTAAITDAAPVSEISSQKVVLKHQDVQDKKDAQGLLNNVIEETASKLAVTRKSKVKALVGAFETVISLQESKPSQTVF